MAKRKLSARKSAGGLPNLASCKTIVFDTETTGVDWRRDHAVGFALCWGPSPAEAGYYSIRHDGGNYDEESVLRWLRNTLARPDLLVIGHNLKFDLHMVENDGIRVAGPVECTQVNEALIDENLHKYSLEDCAGRYEGVPAKKGTALYEYLAGKFGGEATRAAQMGNLHRLSGDDPMGHEYALGDVISTWHLRAAQMLELERQKLVTVWGVEKRLTKILQRMEREGVRVHEERLQWLRFHLGKVLQKNRGAIGDLNVRSAPQIMEFLLKKGHKKIDFPKTDLGNPSFPETYLSKIEWGAKIVAVRKIETLFNSFINPLKESHLWHGRVHCNFNQLKQDDYGVVTGRLSCNGPNMQQIPKRDKDLAPLFRMLFLPDEGHAWGAKDYSQQEYRIFAEYTGSEKLLAGYSADPPVDIHQSVANELGVERDPTAKRMNFGLVNGMGYKKLAVSLEIPISQARKYWIDYDASFPEAKQFLKAAEFYAKQRGWVKTKLGRRRRFPRPEFAHKAGNNIIQGTAADITKSKMVEVAEYLESERAATRLMLSVHDELDLSQAPGEEAIAKRCDEIMVSFGEQDMIQLGVPMAVDAHEAGDWGRASFAKYTWPKGIPQ